MNILTISDLHCPFQHKDAFDFLKELKRKYRPEVVVCLGDEFDAHAIARWPADPDGHSAGYELELALTELKKLYKIFPEVLVCTSNHTARPFRKAFESGLPKAFIKDYKDFLEAPEGWKWGDEWIVDGVIFQHGEGVSGKYAALTLAQKNMCCTVHGHVHSFAGVHYTANPSGVYWGLNAGCLIDTSAYAFSYAKVIRDKPVLGTGVLIAGVPHFIPMQLDKRGRWTGQL